MFMTSLKLQCNSNIIEVNLYWVNISNLLELYIKYKSNYMQWCNDQKGQGTRPLTFENLDGSPPQFSFRPFSISYEII